MTPLEKDIERALTKMVGRHGGLCLKWVCPGWAGGPDRICLLPGGRIVFIELKRPEGGVISSRQKWWADKLSKLGFVHLWIHNHEELQLFRMAYLPPANEQTVAALHKMGQAVHREVRR